MIDQSTLKSIEDLHRLKTDGIITEEEFERSKQKLLFGGTATKASGPAEARADSILNLFGSAPVGLPAKDDHVGWITLPIKRYATFAGRSTRKEFWMFQLIYVVLGVIAAFAIMQGGDIDASPAAVTGGRAVFFLVCLAILGLLVPQLAVVVRRFRDINQSPWLVLISLIPYIGVLIVYFAMLIPGTAGENKFGPDPLAE